MAERQSKGMGLALLAVQMVEVFIFMQAQFQQNLSNFFGLEGATGVPYINDCAGAQTGSGRTSHWTGPAGQGLAWIFTVWKEQQVFHIPTTAALAQGLKQGRVGPSFWTGPAGPGLAWLVKLMPVWPGLHELPVSPVGVPAAAARPHARDGKLPASVLSSRNEVNSTRHNAVWDVPSHFVVRNGITYAAVVEF